MSHRTVAVVLALACASGCERRPKRTLRTEPWPAPAVSSAAPSAVLRALHYVVDGGRVRIELGGKGAKPVATLSAISGDIELDPVRLERSRATLNADLLSLSVTTEGNEDPSLTARALDWLELGAERPAPERERDRFARIEINAFEGVPADSQALPRRAHVVAHGTLTLHHFRVPIELALEVDRNSSDDSRLMIRTQRPFVVSLASHDILSRDARGELAGISEVGTVVGRDARVSAEISARLASPPPAHSSNP